MVTVVVLRIDRCEEVAEQSIMSISALVTDRVTRKCPRQRSVTELPVKTLNEIEYCCGFERKLRSNSKVCADQRGVHESGCAIGELQNG